MALHLDICLSTGPWLENVTLADEAATDPLDAQGVRVIFLRCAYGGGPSGYDLALLCAGMVFQLLRWS